MILNSYLNECMYIESNQKEIDNSITEICNIAESISESAYLNSNIEMEYLDEGFGEKIKNIAMTLWKGLEKIFDKVISALKWIKSKTIDKILNLIKSKKNDNIVQKQADNVEKQVILDLKKKNDSNNNAESSKEEDNKKERDYDYDDTDYFKSNDSKKKGYDYSDAISDLKFQMKLDAEEMAKADATVKVKYLNISKILNNDIFKKIDKYIIKILQQMRDIKSILTYGENAEKKQNDLLNRINENKEKAINIIFETSNSELDKAKNDFYNLFNSRLNAGYEMIKFSEFINSKDKIVNEINSHRNEYMENLNNLKKIISNYIDTLESIKKNTRKYIINRVENGVKANKKYLSINYQYSDKEINKFKNNGGIHDRNADVSFDNYTQKKDIDKRIQQDNRNRLNSVEQKMSQIIASELAAMNVIVGCLNYRISIESTSVKISNFIIDKKDK